MGNHGRVLFSRSSHADLDPLLTWPSANIESTQIYQTHLTHWGLNNMVDILQTTFRIQMQFNYIFCILINVSVSHCQSVSRLNETCDIYRYLNQCHGELINVLTLRRPWNEIKGMAVVANQLPRFKPNMFKTTSMIMKGPRLYDSQIIREKGQPEHVFSGHMT